MALRVSDDKMNVLQSIVGEQLSSVEFVQDYIQFRFDGPCLTAFTNPVVSLGETRLQWDDLGYCDAVRRCIGRKVLNAGTSPGVAITIDLERGANISVSLKPEDYKGPEAAVFQGTREWTVWRDEVSAADGSAGEQTAGTP
jgi:hypothetical protein